MSSHILTMETDSLEIRRTNIIGKKRKKERKKERKKKKKKKCGGRPGK